MNIFSKKISLSFVVDRLSLLVRPTTNHQRSTILSLTPYLLSLLFLASCASKEPTPGYYKVGKPYQVEGKWYKPKQQADYDEVGMASWYGSDFHKKQTANGGTFNKNVLSAAHKTLPLPSMVKVTNLSNNKTLIVMVNDRGPFSNDRIIDVSERAAEILGFKDKGVTKVRVQYLPGQTKRLLSDLPGSKGVKEAEERAFAGSVKSAKLDVVPEVVVPASPVNSVSRVFTSTANEAVVDDVAIENKVEEKAESAVKPKAKAPGAEAEDAVPAKVLPAAIKPAKVAETSKEVQYIQAGTYGIKGNAERVSKKLAPIGTVSISPITVNGKELYKVKVGPLLDKRTSELALKKVIVLGHPDAMLVKENAVISQ